VPRDIWIKLKKPAISAKYNINIYIDIDINKKGDPFEIAF